MFSRSSATRTLVWLVCGLVLLSALPGQCQTEKYSLVRFWLDTPAAEAFLQSRPDFDLVTWKPGVHADIVVRENDLRRLRESGARLDILQDDLAAFYRSRLAPDKSDDFGIFHNWPEAVAFLDSLNLAYPDVISAKWSLGTSIEGRDIWCIRVSDNPEVDENEAEILFDGTHHARELMACEFPLMFAEYLGQQYYAGDPEVTWLLENREVYIVPVVNPDGYWYNDYGDMWRKNRRNNGSGCYGVDLNRNYTYEWDGPGSSTDPCHDLYRGTMPGSEPETQAMMNFINSHEFITRNSFHCYGNLTLYPWGYTTDHTPDHDIFVHMGQEMTKYNGYTPQVGYTLYPVNGGSLDWDYGADYEHTKIFGFVNEIGNSSDGFWATEARRQPLFDENIWPSIYLMRVSDAFLTVSDPVVLGGDGNGRLDPGENADLSLTLANQSIVATVYDAAFTVCCDDPYIQLGNCTHTLGTMTPLATSDLTGSPLTVVVDPDCPVGRQVPLRVTATHSGGSLEFPLSLTVGPPTVVFSDDLESGDGNWTLSGGWAVSAENPYAGSYGLSDSPGGNYPDNNTATATL
ncbi:MAG: M14 family metallopeptidase, partial [bacterium]